MGLSLDGTRESYVRLTPSTCSPEDRSMTDQAVTDTNPAATIDTWLAEAAARQELNAKLLVQNKTALFDALVATGVTRVSVSFDGVGDSGQIEDISVRAGDAVVDLPAREIEMVGAEWGQKEPQRAPMKLSEAIEQLVYDILEDTHMGWEHNAGAFGEFTFDTAEQSITLDYNERYESSVYYQHLF
jgi:hypothetical protein